MILGEKFWFNCNGAIFNTNHSAYNINPRKAKQVQFSYLNKKKMSTKGEYYDINLIESLGEDHHTGNQGGKREERIKKEQCGIEPHVLSKFLFVNL